MQFHLPSQRYQKHNIVTYNAPIIIYPLNSHRKVIGINTSLYSRFALLQQLVFLKLLQL